MRPIVSLVLVTLLAPVTVAGPYEDGPQPFFVDPQGDTGVTIVSEIDIIAFDVTTSDEHVYFRIVLAGPYDGTLSHGARFDIQFSLPDVDMMRVRVVTKEGQIRLAFLQEIRGNVPAQHALAASYADGEINVVVPQMLLYHSSVDHLWVRSAWLTCPSSCVDGGVSGIGDRAPDAGYYRRG